MSVGAPWPRRAVLTGAAAVMLGAAAPAANPQLVRLEQRLQGGRLGVEAMNLGDGRRLAHRADERFALCSTFKLLLAAAVLARVDAGRERLGRLVPYGRKDMLSHAPVTEAHLHDGRLSVEALCHAAVVQSDNPAANLLLASLGGPAGLTAWLRRTGDGTTRLDRWELALNSATPGDPRDTTTPAAMAATTARLLGGDLLTPASRRRLANWMVAADTGRARLRKGLPPSLTAGDKTGTGQRGSCNDIAMIWPAGAAPIVVAAFTAGGAAPLAVREVVLAQVGRIVAESLV